jgi:heme/copper-type cytochrome/quinol oxidase subunit 3
MTAHTEEQASHHHEQHAFLWPPVLGLSTGILGLGIYFLTRNRIFEGFLTLIIFLAIFVGFCVHEILQRKQGNFGVFPDDSHLTTKWPKNSWMWLFLSSEVVFFGLLIGLSFALRIAVESGLAEGYFGHLHGLYTSGNQNIYEGWGAYIHGEFKNSQQLFREGPTLIIVSVNTFILICSSFTMVWAHQASEEGNWIEARNRLIYTAIIGTIFLSIQVYEYYELIAEGFTPASGLMGSTFYLQTGFHGAHVLAGVILILVMAYKAHIGAMEDASDVENIGLYWHFVDLVWVLLFTLVYLV